MTDQTPKTIPENDVDAERKLPLEENEDSHAQVHQLPNSDDFRLITKKNGRTFWVSFFGVIIVLASVVLFLEHLADQQLRQSAEEQRDKPNKGPEIIPPMSIVRLLIGDNHYSVPEQSLTLLSANIDKTLRVSSEKSEQEMEQYINTEIDKIFLSSIKRIPSFADWYYSLGGEYSRLASAATGDASEYLVSKMKELIFQSSDFEGRLDNMLSSLDKKIIGELNDLQSAVTTEVEKFISVNIVSTENKTVEIREPINLSQVISQRFGITENDVVRLSATTLSTLGILTAGKALGATVIKSLIPKLASKKAVQAAVALLAKLVAKAGVKGGSALAVSAGATLACAPTGPFAIACGAITGIATWLIVDKAFVEIDEVINRQEFEEEIRQAFLEQQIELKQNLINAYKALLRKQFNAIQEQLQVTFNEPNRDFVPANSFR
jgi:hypothetical protein